MSVSTENIFRRKIYQDLEEWKKNDSGRYALMIEGVRRVGKSKIVKEFGTREYRSCLMVDFLTASDAVKNMFNRYSDDPDRLFRLLSGYYGVRLFEYESLVVFDEVQEFPRAHQLVKYLVAYGKYPIIETGSLITLRMKTRITFPSEVRTIPMNPMDFEEYMWAVGKEQQLEMVRESFESGVPMDEDMHRNLMDTYTTYMITGGMPQAVSALIETNSFVEVEKSKKMIVDLYREDVWREDDGILAELFSGIPSMLNRTNKVFSPGAIKKSLSEF
ncbi:MAG: AAA family ATPase [Candidatus Methanomethylophilaceae archaeon]|nr:AAA family ATPase [Candidatus Methanomethylophilaceae archaeon]